MHWNFKKIGLTAGGVLGAGLLIYLVYRHEQNAAAASQAASQAAAQAAAQQAQQDQSTIDSIGAQTSGSAGVSGVSDNTGSSASDQLALALLQDYFGSQSSTTSTGGSGNPGTGTGTSGGGSAGNPTGGNPPTDTGSGSGIGTQPNGGGSWTPTSGLPRPTPYPVPRRGYYDVEPASSGSSTGANSMAAFDNTTIDQGGYQNQRAVIQTPTGFYHETAGIHE